MNTNVSVRDEDYGAEAVDAGNQTSKFANKVLNQQN